MNKRIFIGILTGALMIAIMAVGTIAYTKADKKAVLVPQAMMDSFKSRVVATSNGKEIYPIACDTLIQDLLVTNDTVLIVYPYDTLRQPLMGKPYDLVNNNHTLVCRSSTGDSFSLTYFFDSKDSTGISPILIIKHPDQVIFLSHTPECDKLVKYLKSN